MSSTLPGAPDGYPVLSPYLIIRDANAAIDLYQRAFGADVLVRMLKADGTVFHAEIAILGAVIMIGDAEGNDQALPDGKVTFFLYVDDVDAWTARAVAAGMMVIDEPKDKPEGERRGGVQDPFGFTWWLGTVTRPMSRPEMQRQWDTGGLRSQ